MQAVETLELRLSDEQIAAIRLRVERRKREIAAAELRARQEAGVVDLGVIGPNRRTAAASPGSSAVFRHLRAS
jgi:hypothetical protein